MAKQKKQQKTSREAGSLEQLKRLAIIAMFSDDELMDRLVLKGGNAMDLIHRVSTRASVDLDFSMQDDFPPGQREAFRRRVEDALRMTFREAGFEVFDVKMEERPEAITADLAEFWGGYGVEFKLIKRDAFDRLSANIDDLRRNALPLGRGTKFLIDISRLEHTQGKEAQLVNGYRIFVYSPAMIVCEKLRAICQQMPEYGPVVKRNRPGSARARDFLDIHTLVLQRNVDVASPEHRELLVAMFRAKRVPLPLLGLIQNYREFHLADFAAVRATVKAGVTLHEFDHYFDIVVGLVERLKPLWDV